MRIPSLCPLIFVSVVEFDDEMALLWRTQISFEVTNKLACTKETKCGKPPQPDNG